jgi:exodeoxyribonuclease-5
MTENQKEVMSNILDSLFKYNKLSCALSGKAGVGKTYLVSNLIKKVRSTNTPVVVCAPTHQAVNVLNSSNPDLCAVTIHSVLGLLPDFELKNFNPEKPEFGRNKEDNMPNKGLLIVDEASMIGKNIIGHIKTLCKGYKSKVLFVGDFKQMNPVGESSNGIFNSEVHDVFHLTEVLRTKSASIQKYVDDIRDGDIYIPEPSDDIRVIDKRDYQYDDDCILAYTNKSVSFWNSNYKLHHHGTEKLIEGDSIRFYRSVGNIQNGSVGIVTSISGQFVFADIDGFGKERLSLCTDEKKYKDDYMKNRNKAMSTQGVEQRKKEWAKFYSFRNSNLIMDDISIYRKNHGKPEFITVKKDFDFSYAQTIHKAQGRSIEFLAVDYKDIRGKEINELMYVAMSRVSVRLTILV